MTESRDEAVNGALIAARILQRMDATTQERLVKEISRTDPSLAQKIEENIFRIEDLLLLSDSGIKRLVSELDHRDLAAALAIAPSSVKEKVLTNVPPSRAGLLANDIEILPSLNRADAELAQKKLLTKLDELKTEGAIQTAGKRGVWA